MAVRESLDKCVVELLETNEGQDKAVVELTEEKSRKKEQNPIEKCPNCGGPVYKIALTGERYCFSCKKYI